MSLGGGSVFTPVVKWLIIINVVVLVLQVVVRSRVQVQIPESALPLNVVIPEHRFYREHVTEWLGLDTDKVLQQGQVWRLLTYGFCHSTKSPWHILFNMLFLYFLGRAMEQLYGSKEFLLSYLVATMFAGGLIVLVQGFWTGMRGMTIGASGAVTAVLVLYALHYPRQVLMIFGIIPIEVRWIVIIKLIFDTYPFLRELSVEQYSDGVSHAGHIGGAIFAYLYWKYRWRFTPTWNRVEAMFNAQPSASGFGRRSKLKVYAPDDEPRRRATSSSISPDEVDRILAKIHEQGEASLTDAERDVMKQASEQTKRRLNS